MKIDISKKLYTVCLAILCLACIISAKCKLIFLKSLAWLSTAHTARIKLSQVDVGKILILK